MSKARLESWKSCEDTRKVIHFAEQHGVEVINAHGDHIKFFNPRNGESVIGVHKREMSPGVARQIFSKFKTWGLLSIAALFFLAYLWYSCPPVIYDNLYAPLAHLFNS